MILKKYDIPTDFRNRIFKIYSSGCWHATAEDNTGYSENIINEFVKTVESDPDGMSILMGDITDKDRFTVRKQKHSFKQPEPMSNLNHDDMLDMKWLDEKVIPNLKRIQKAGRGCLGMLEGNHHIQFANGETSTQYMCRKANIPYLGYGEAYIRLVFRVGKQKTKWKNRGVIFNIVAFHGTSLSEQQLLKAMMTWRDVNLVISSHTHELYGKPKCGLFVSDNMEIKEKPMAIMRSGSALKSRVVGKTSYSEVAGMIPHPLGWTEAEIHLGFPKENNRNGFVTKIRVIA